MMAFYKVHCIVGYFKNLGELSYGCASWEFVPMTAWERKQLTNHRLGNNKPLVVMETFWSNECVVLAVIWNFYSGLLEPGWSELSWPWYHFNISLTEQSNTLHLVMWTQPGHEVFMGAQYFAQSTITNILLENMYYNLTSSWPK